MTVFVAALIVGLLASGAAQADEANVLDVTVAKEPAGTYRFEATVEHADEGWDHYAEKWDVIAPDGTVLGSRVLAHPHVDEQPFTRSLSGIEIPKGVENVTIRAFCSTHGFGGTAKVVVIPR